MVPALHLIMIVAAASSLCCVLGSRRTRSITAVGGTVLMAAAMADLALGLVGLAPLGWTAALLAWAMVAAGAARWRERRAATGQTVSADSAIPGATAAGRRQLHLLHQLGLVVVAGQIALCASMADGAGSSARLAAGSGVGLTHPHSVSVFVAVVCVAGALFVVAAAAMVLVGQRSRPERGNLLSMSVMTAAMAVMPFG